LNLFEITSIFYISLWIIVVVIFNLKILDDNYTILLSKFFILPNWSFFSPHPLITDYNLFYRVVDKNHSQNEYLKVEFANSNKMSHIFFNKGKRKTKFVLDTVLDLIEELKKTNKNDYKYIPYSLQYLLLLNYIISEITAENIKSVQFKICEQSYVNNSEKIIFQSFVHDV
jgi:hypothetical protein